MARRQTITLDGKDYVIVDRAEFDRLTILSKAAGVPELPEADEDGNFPAVEYARISLARKIIKERAAAGLSQRELADLAGIRFETLCRIETGKHTPSMRSITAIDKVLNKIRAKPRRQRVR